MGLGAVGVCGRGVFGGTVGGKHGNGHMVYIHGGSLGYGFCRVGV